MKTKLFILVAIVALMGLARQTPTMAQDAEPPCAVDDALNVEYQSMVQRDWLQTVITILNANIEDADTTNFLGTARELRRVLARLDADCRGLHFTNDSDGMQPVIGPVALTGGTWKVTFTTAGYGTVEMEELGGDCGRDSLLFAMFADQATDGSQAIIKIGESCEALISVSNTGKPWDLMFELVKAAD